ncbi:MAG: hypothetical protein FIA89_14525 [Geobacter sp.]|nr:hypothetical protein [Geobacter sp.]
MPETVHQIPASRKYLWAVLLGLLGFAGNWLRFPLFLNVDLLFGSIFVMLALQYLGLGPALLSAVIAGCATLLIWNHPHALIIFTAELLLTGLLYQRWKGELLVANCCYWLVIGMPLGWLFYHLVMALDANVTLAIMFKQAMNGLANTVLARLIALALQTRGGMPPLPHSPTLRERVATLLALFSMVTTLVLLALTNRQEMAFTRQQIIAMLTAAHGQAAATFKATAAASPEEINKQLRLLINSAATFTRVSYTHYDARDVPQLSNRTPLPPIPHSGGTLQAVTPLISWWIPDARPNIAIMERWHRSVFLTRLPVAGGTLVIQTAMAPWLAQQYRMTTQILTTALLLVIASLAAGFWLSNRICRSLQRLGTVSQGLAKHLDQGTEPDWPQSTIPEVAQVTADLQDMTGSLTQALAAEQHSLQLLKRESARRENLEQMLEQQREHERLRISRELHDGIGQSLQAIKLNLQLQSVACRRRSCGFESETMELVSDIEQIVSSLRSVITSMRQAPDSTGNIAQDLQAMGGKISALRGCRFTLHQSGPVDRLPENINKMLFFIALEAVTNAIRHAAPREITLSLAIHTAPRRLIMTIADDGCGGASSTTAGAGISIMEERAALIGGSFRIASAQGTGTTITVEVPLA